MDLGTIWSPLVCILLMTLYFPDSLDKSTRRLLALESFSTVSQKKTTTHREESICTLEFSIFLLETKETFTSELTGLVRKICSNAW